LREESEKKRKERKEERWKDEESPEARTERGSRKRGRTTVCLGIAQGVTERIVSLDIFGAT